MRKIIFILLLLLWSSAALYVLGPEPEVEKPSRQAQRSRIEKSIRPANLWQNKT